MVKDDASLKKSPAALKMAARLAKAELQPAEKAHKETTRQQRIAAQAGETGRPGEDDDDDTQLSPMQKKFLARMNADGGVQVSEEAFAKRAKKGVNMSTRMAYQPGQMDWGK